MKKYITKLWILFCVAGIGGCKKYELAPEIENPAYIRVFNDIDNSTDVYHSQQPPPFLTFLMDPKTDKSGVPEDAGVVGDYLGTRQLFSLSYPINEANSSVNQGQLGQYGYIDPTTLTPVNYEYPGNAHVLAAPAINGLDLSAWAQIPSGKHRILFVIRPQTAVGFKQLPAAIRSNILLDTTVDFEKGEVYTLEVVTRDLDQNKYGLYVRREQFIHQAFEQNKIYAGFVNLSGKAPLSAQYAAAFHFPEKTKIYYSYSIYNDAASSGNDAFYRFLPGYAGNYYSTLTTTMDTVIPYLSLPLLPENYFYYQGLLRTYGGIAYYGTLPYFSFNLFDNTKPLTQDPVTGIIPLYTLNCVGDPNTINNYNPNTTTARNSLPNLNLIVNTGNISHVYSTVNILEMVYDRIYMMQIQRSFDEVPKN